MMEKIRAFFGVSPAHPYIPPPELTEAYGRFADETVKLAARTQQIEKNQDVFQSFVRGMREGLGRHEQ